MTLFRSGLQVREQSARSRSGILHLFVMGWRPQTDFKPAMQPRAILSVILGFGLGLTCAVAAATEAATATDVLAITIDQAKVAKVPSGTATLVVGNPAIADVTMLKGGVTMVVTAKGYGETNLVAIDASGNILDEKQIRVDPARTMLVVQRGAARASYSCNPWCMPTVQLGDDNTVFGEAGGQISTRNGLATGMAGPK
jgi:hypothetical protein